MKTMFAIALIATTLALPGCARPGDADNGTTAEAPFVNDDFASGQNDLGANDTLSANDDLADGNVTTEGATDAAGNGGDLNASAGNAR